jgi:hypothetical protein
MNKIAALATVLMLALCAASTSAQNANSPSAIHVDDADTSQPLEQITYDGKWQHVASMRDGRYDGTSTRSHRAGDSLVFAFQGAAVRIYGVRGPNGGDAEIAIDGKYLGTVSFLAARKQVHVLVFASPPLVNGLHNLRMVVVGAPPSSHRGYVNIDEIEVQRYQ